MKNILLTGGAGFIGSYICRNLLNLGYQPVVYDAFIQYISPFESLYQKYLEYRFKGIKKDVVFIRGDIRDKDDIERIILKYKPERIIHLAAMPIADLSFIHQAETLGSIILGTVNILDIISKVDFIKRFIYTSSSMVYGDFEIIPAPEEHLKKPKDIYGGTKYCGEILTETYGRRFGINYTIIRPSAVYGPTDVNRRVVQVFIENALKGKKLTLHGGESNIIDFSYVEDVAEGFVLAALSDKAQNQVFNITRGEGRSLKELTDILKEFFPNLEVGTTPLQVYRPKRGALSIEKAKNLLGYNPKYSLRDGIIKYLEFMKEIQG